MYSHCGLLCYNRDSLVVGTSTQAQHTASILRAEVSEFGTFFTNYQTTWCLNPEDQVLEISDVTCYKLHDLPCEVYIRLAEQDSLL
jgi:hypothetical protein